MNITMSPQQPMLSVTKAIPFQSGIFADVWRVTQERYYQVKKVCRTALINPALIWRGYAILPFATEYRENRVALNANSLADNVELDETVVTVIPTHGAIARATFNAQIGGKVLMTLKYGNKSVPFGAIVTHGENKNGSIVAENGQVYLTGLPQSGQLQVSWGKDKNSNCIVEYKLPEVSPGTLLNQQTAICR